MFHRSSARIAALSVLGAALAAGGGIAAAAPAPWPAECPTDLRCEVVPAAHQQYGPKVEQYGSYWVADRPRELPVRYVVIHNTEETYADTLKIFTDPKREVSAHYVVRSADGHVAQMVRVKDAAWQAGNRAVNFHSVGIEHEGYAAQGDRWYTEQLYRSSARVVRQLAARYGFPLDRGHILGHDTVPARDAASVRGMHWDPGPYWDWARYFELLGAPLPGAGRDGVPRAGQQVVVNPVFARNQQTVTICSGNPVSCAPRTAPSNFLPLFAEPRVDAPRFGDPGLHGPGRPGSDRVSDWGARVSTGERFVVAEQRGEWTAVWFAGGRAWFHNPGGRHTARAHGLVIRPRKGVKVTVYGQTMPEAAAVKPPVTQTPPDSRLTGYALPAGQRYAAYTAPVRSRFVQLTSIDRSQPGDGTVVVGNRRYYPIQYHYRLAFVDAAEVEPTTG